MWRTRTLPDGGRISSLRVVGSEIQTRLSLVASEGRYRLLADSIGDMVPSVGPVLGWAAETLVGRSTRDLTHPDDQSAITAAVADANRGETTLQGTRMLSKSRGWVWTECNVTPYLDADGRRAGQVVIARDISAQVQFEAAAAAAIEDLGCRSSHDLLTGLRNRYDPQAGTFTP